MFPKRIPCCPLFSYCVFQSALRQLIDRGAVRIWRDSLLSFRSLASIIRLPFMCVYHTVCKRSTGHFGGRDTTRKLRENKLSARMKAKRPVLPPAVSGLCPESRKCQVALAQKMPPRWAVLKLEVSTALVTIANRLANMQGCRGVWCTAKVTPTHRLQNFRQAPSMKK